MIRKIGFTKPDEAYLKAETADWLDSLEDVLYTQGPDRVSDLLTELQIQAQRHRSSLPVTSNTPYENTIPATLDAKFPGDRAIERRIKSLIRWNAMAMVVRANMPKTPDGGGVGGHISTFASSATLYEIGFNHFFRGPEHECGGDLVFFQGHASPGVYSRAFIEGRLTHDHLVNFRRELQPKGGLSSYPHPWLMPDFWQFATVSMGLGPLKAIYLARYLRYLENRGLKPKSDRKVWAFLGDGECDEPETLGSISLAAREKLDNLIFVINCNLQRLDGPVRGNGSIVQELERVFRGAGWNVIKLLWGKDWDPLYHADTEGLLTRRKGGVVDGEYQKYSVEGGAYIREKFYGTDPRLLKMVSHLSDEQLWKMRLGGHDPDKVYTAYKAATSAESQPTVILARTIKGYGLGEAGEGKNITHQQKKLNEVELKSFRDRFEIPISDKDLDTIPFYRPTENSEEMQYLQERRKALGGYLPQRRTRASTTVTVPGLDKFAMAMKSYGPTDTSNGISSTAAFVNILRNLLRDKELGKLIVPIIPDEARTFGMDPLFRSVGIYSSIGQLYEPVDSDQTSYYREAKDGQILEEGITEAGAMSSFLAAGTAYSTADVNTIPMYIYYSMFGFQRVGDSIWAAADMRARGFLLGATAGRTTLNGEGLQHQDGHSHLLALPVPNLLAYDPAYSFELAVIIQEGLRRMVQEQECIFYYITLYNDNYEHPEMPKGEGIREGILNGMYKLKASELKKAKLQAQILGSGPLLRHALKAQQLLAEKYRVAADIWSVTSYKQLRMDGLECDRWNLLHPGEAPKVPFVTRCLKNESGVFVAVSDNMKALPDLVAKWLPRPLAALGTEGFGRSETREALRDFFEIDERYIVLATLTELVKDGKLEVGVLKQAIQELGIQTDKPSPLTT